MDESEPKEYLIRIHADLALDLVPIVGFLSMFINNQFGPLTKKQNETLRLTKHLANNSFDYVATIVDDYEIIHNNNKVEFDTYIEDIQCELNNKYVVPMMFYLKKFSESEDGILTNEQQEKSRLLMEHMNNLFIKTSQIITSRKSERRVG